MLAPSSSPLAGASFGDDNARVLTAAVLTMAILRQQPWGMNTSQWARGVVKSLLANIRTCSDDGYRWGRMNMGDFNRGWQYYYYSSESHLQVNMGDFDRGWEYYYYSSDSRSFAQVVGRYGAAFFLSFFFFFMKRMLQLI